MALRLLRLLPASASARGLAAGAQRVVSGGRHVLLGSRPVVSDPRRPGVVGQTLEPQAPEVPTHSSGCSFAEGLSKLLLGNRDAGALESGPASSSVQCLAKLLG